MKRYFHILALLVISSFTSCELQESIKPAQEPKMQVETLPATDVEAFTAVLNASFSFSSDNPEDVPVLGFFVSTSAELDMDYAMRVESEICSASSFSANLSGLQEATDFYYCAFIECGSLLKTGSTLSFCTDFDHSGSGTGSGNGGSGSGSGDSGSGTGGSDSGSGSGTGSGNGGSGTGDSGSGSGNGGSGSGGSQGTGTAYHPGWPELPAIFDDNRDHVWDKDSDIYVTSHSFSMSGKQYRNYTVCFSAEHHCPLWVAAPRHSVYEQKNVGRSDAYGSDPDIPSSVQYSSKSTGGGCNKGHMLGSAERLCCSEANRQVFYYSNIAPQYSSGFNTGGGGWNILEDYVDGQVCSDTLYVVIGCYFDQYKDGYGKSASPKTISFGGRDDVSCPTMFYYALLRTKSGSTGKSVKDCQSSELKCAAFVRTHTNNLKGQKPSSKELMSIEELEKITGFTYFTNVPNAPKSSFSASDWGL